ncbi:unnamed protein product [Dibothriocephalus latus]|uniref:Uncharacterized protein n=1 Tax=Dibothriocephalus latus TaxID=60516 RepID=A0A3P7LVE5_DIBLA|nr:unnamed protein product [Dibothriocephalus latus]
MSEKDDNMEVSETVIFPVSDFRIAPSLSNPRELLSQISSIAKNLQAILESESPIEDSFTDLYSPKLAYKDFSSALTLSCDETPNVTLSAEEVAQPLSNVPKSDLLCCTVAADQESLPAGAAPDDLPALTRLRKFLRTVSSKSLTDLTASFQNFCDHFVALETERLLLEEECASLRAATSAPRQNDLNQTTVFEMIEKVCANAEDNIEELQTSLKDAKSRAAEFEAKVESLTLELSKQSASNTQLHSELVEAQEQIQAKMTALSDLEIIWSPLHCSIRLRESGKNAALNEQVIIQEKEISSLESAYGKALENLRAANAELLETKGQFLSFLRCTLHRDLDE